jgi:hypothetical protein
MGLIGGLASVDDVVCEMSPAYSGAVYARLDPGGARYPRGGRRRLGHSMTPLDPRDQTLEQLRADPGAELQQRRLTDPGRALARGHGAVVACGSPGVTDRYRWDAALGTAR